MRGEVVGNTMYARNAINDLKQHELSTLIIERVGTNSPKIDTIEITESSCVGNVITRFIESISMRLSQTPSYLMSI
jgi:hypothetical protein